MNWNDSLHCVLLSADPYNKKTHIKHEHFKHIKLDTTINMACSCINWESAVKFLPNISLKNICLKNLRKYVIAVEISPANENVCLKYEVFEFPSHVNDDK